jgi:hypothetical protein
MRQAHYLLMHLLWKANKSRDAFVPESSKVIRMSEKSVVGLRFFSNFQHICSISPELPRFQLEYFSQ